MKKQSLWSEYGLKQYNTLKTDLETDVLVIGGGISGILCSYELSKRGISSVVVEKNNIGGGTSKNTTAFLTAHHDLLYHNIIDDKSFKKAKEYIDLNYRALERYRELSNHYRFDYYESDLTIYSSHNKDKIYKEKEALKKLGIDNVHLVDNIPFTNDAIGLRINHQAHINPMKLINELSKELVIYEKTNIVKLKRNYALTADNHRILFKNVVIATNYPIINKRNFLFTKLTKRKSYVCVINNKKVDSMYCSIDEDGLYFRNYNDFLIIGGNDRDIKNKCSYTFYKKINNLFSEEDISYYWSGQDCISLDGIPYIGNRKLLYRHHYYVTGFNLWGFTWAMSASIMIADMIEGQKQNSLTKLSRWWFNKVFLSNMINSVKCIFSLKKPRCSHMYSKLNFNKEENIYECPCHGSSFDENGILLDGPSSKNINIKND